MTIPARMINLYLMAAITGILDLTVLVSLVNCKIIETFFTHETICDVDHRIDIGCSYPIPSALNKLRCVAMCSSDTLCNGVSTNLTQCVKHYDCPSLYQRCQDGDNSKILVSKKCQNEGSWNSSSKRCDCVGNWVGQRCQLYPQFCKDLLDRYESPETEKVRYHVIHADGNTTSSILAPTFFNPQGHYCHVIVMYNYGDTLFNKTWQEFRDGFYPDGNTNIPAWIGLNALHLLTHNDHTHLIVMLAIAGVGAMEKQYTIKILDESNDFRISQCTKNWASVSFPMTQRGHTFGSCLEDMVNISFSTWDHDRDGDQDSNCASQAGIGWWFNSCHNPCNLMGLKPSLWDSNTLPERRLSVPGFVGANETNEDILVTMHLSR